MSEPTASTLAADVLRAFMDTHEFVGDSDIEAARNALDALVAQVDTLTRDVRTAMDAAERFREQGMKDAERAEAAEAALADTRRQVEYVEGVLMRDPFDDGQRRFAAELLRRALAGDTEGGQQS